MTEHVHTEGGEERPKACAEGAAEGASEKNFGFLRSIEAFSLRDSDS